MEPDPLTSAVVFIHQIFIICIVAILAFALSHVIWAIAEPTGTKNINPLNKVTLVSGSVYSISWGIVKICEVLACIILVFLLWIFVFWMIIKIIVPYIIIFPIPIIPFIFIIPLKPILLEFIPPFKVLTEIGTLPLMLRILTTLINPQIFTNTINYLFFPTAKDVGSYLKTHITNTITNVI